MRLHRLRITAFGPFAGTESVDFDELTGSGLYLIHGATGAGKTSILDAICFALYAAVPGARAGSRGTLRSDHAEGHVAPEVELELTVAGRRLRLTRSPAFARPKKRGDGETTVPATVLLQELVEDEWTTKGTRNDEVAQVIDDVVGLGLEQFVKVVMLPQGEFATFLRATPEDRRALLERLFDTGRFIDVENWLAERRRESAATLEASRSRVRTQLQRVDDVLGDLDPVATSTGAADAVGPLDDVVDEVPGEGAGDDAPEVAAPPRWSALDPDQVDLQLGEIAGRVADLAALALARSDAAAGARDRAAQELTDARRTLELQRRGQRAQGTLAAVEECADVREDSARNLERARRARELVAHLDAHDDAIARTAQSRATAQSARVEAEAVCPSLAASDEDTGPASVRLLADEVDAASALLTRAQSALERARAARSRFRDLSAQVADTRARVEQLRQRSAREEERRGALHAQLEALTASAGELETHRARLLELRRATALAERRSGAADTIAALALDETALARTSIADGAEVVRLHRLRIEGMAGELATGLVDGEDCPVCGSAEHPHPAPTTAEVTSDQIEAAQRRATESREAHEEARRELAVLRAEQGALVDQLEECLQQLDLSFDPALVAAEALQGLTDEAATAAAAAQEAAQARDDTAQELADLAASAEATATEHHTVRAELAATEATRAAARSETVEAIDQVATLVSEHHEACPCADPAAATTLLEHGVDDTDFDHAATSPSDATLVGRCEEAAGRLPGIITRHRRATGRLAELVTALRDHEAAERSVDHAREQLRSGLTEHGFADASAAREALRSDAQIAELEGQLQEFDRRRQGAEDVLADPEVASALNDEAPDIEELVGLERAAREAHTAADRTFAHYDRAERRLQSLAREVHQALTQLRGDESEHATLRDLADCVAGTGPDNLLKMRLSSFVLAARLEEVARHANERLTVMSDGRYSLRHSDARAARGARSGLGLRVTDAWTGIERETATLSGGEAFLASLALALGLGDAVRAEAGGLDLQTLFVDEGFGSLDEESLEHVMGVLDGLREGGRSVGIVSHVPELRQRIPAQVRVAKTPAGSHLKVRTAAAGDDDLGDHPAA